MRWMGVVEGAVLIGGMFAIERFGLLDFDALPIHPLMIVVSLLAVQYGAIGGIGAALAATLLSVLGGLLPVRIVGEGYFDYLAAVWSTPLLWLVVAVLLGIISDTGRRELAKVESDLMALQRERDVIAAQCEVLSQRARKLERRAVGLEPQARRQES